MKKIIYTAAILALGFSASAQVGIGTTSPSNSSMLDISSTTKGFLLPRMTSAQRDAVASPATGLQVFDTTTNTFWFYNGTAWINGGVASAQDLRLVGTNNHVTADAGVGSNGSSLGTGTDNIAIGQNAMKLGSTGQYNIALGINALRDMTSATGNVAIGASALSKNNSNGNIAIGYNASINTTGGNNTIVGFGALSAATTASQNTAMGVSALQSVSTGNFNAVFGNAAGTALTTGSRNLAIGNDTAFPNNAGDYQMNIANGIFGTGMNGSVTAPAGNIGIGTTAPSEKLEVAGKTKTTALQVTTGATPGYVLTSDATGNATWTAAGGAGTNYWTSNGANLYNNTATNIGINNTSPSGELHLSTTIKNKKIVLYGGADEHTFYGFGVNSFTLRYQVENAAASHVFYAGAGALASTELMRIKGDGNVGIGTASPSEKLEVAGKTKTANLQVTTGATPGYVLTSDATGNATWTAAPAGGSNFWTLNGANLTNNSGTNVGIGTTAPAAKLDVVETAAGTDNYIRVKSAGANNTASGIKLMTYDSNYGAVIESTERTAAGTERGLHFKATYGTATATSASKMFINSVNGNVGIGTTVPTSKLTVDGAATNLSAYNGGSATSIDFANSNLAYTTSSPAAFTLTNLKDGGTYTLAVQGTTSGTASFSQSGITFKYVNNGATTAAKQTLYTIIMMGTTAYVYMAAGF